LGFEVKPLFRLVSVVKDSTVAIRRGDHPNLPFVFIVEELDPFLQQPGFVEAIILLCRLSQIPGGRSSCGSRFRLVHAEYPLERTEIYSSKPYSFHRGRVPSLMQAEFVIGAEFLCWDETSSCSTEIFVEGPFFSQVRLPC